MAHHTNYAEPPNDVLYANDWLANRTYVFDLHDPRHPRLVREFGGVGELRLSPLLCLSFQRRYARNISVFRRIQPRRGRTGGVRSARSGSEDRLGGRARISKYPSIQPGRR